MVYMIDVIKTYHNDDLVSTHNLINVIDSFQIVVFKAFDVHSDWKECLHSENTLF